MPNETRGQERFGACRGSFPSPVCCSAQRGRPLETRLFAIFFLSVVFFFLALHVYLVVSFQASSLSLEAALSTSTGMAQKRIHSPRAVPAGPVIPLHQPWGGMRRRCLPHRNHPEPFSPKSWLSPAGFACCAAPWLDFFFSGAGRLLL